MCKIAENLTNTLWVEWDKGIRNNGIQNNLFVNNVVAQSQSCGCQHCRYELNRLDAIFLNESDKWFPINYNNISALYLVATVLYGLALFFDLPFMSLSPGLWGLFSLFFTMLGAAYIDEWIITIQRDPNRAE